MKLTPLQYRVLEISRKHGLSHLGSCISCVQLIDDIYAQKREDEPFLLGNGHAGLALYVVLEAHYGFDAEAILVKHGIHATRDPEYKIWGSGGSLGQLETVAVGMAMADRTKDVYLMSSDGSLQEGASWEALWLKHDLKLDNLKWYVNANGLAAYREIDVDKLTRAVHAIDENVRVVRTDFVGIPFLNGLSAHYHKLTDADWTWVEEHKP